MVIDDLRGYIFAGATGGYVSRSPGGVYPLLVDRSLAYLLAAHLLAAWERGIKRKMAGSEESDKYKKKIFQKVGLFIIRHYS